jgi:hypothetical protein
LRAPSTAALSEFWGKVWNPEDLDESDLAEVLNVQCKDGFPAHAELIEIARLAILKTRVAKAPGCDEIYHESIRAAAKFSAYHCARMYEELLEMGAKAWPRFAVRCVLLPKVSIPTTPKNWRPLGLYAAYEKILIQMNFQRILATMRRDVFCEVQAGVPGAGGALELAHAIQLHLATKAAYAMPAVLLQLDLSRAYDMVRHRDVAEALLEAGVPEDVVRWTILSLRCSVYKVRHPIYAEEFEIPLGQPRWRQQSCVGA